MSRVQVKHYTIPLSGTVSEAMPIVGAEKIGLLISIPTSCTGFLEVSHTVNSEDFRRRGFAYSNGSVLATWNIGSGMVARELTAEIGAFPYFRLQTNVPMSSVASLVVVTKF